jgi:DNA-binding transcriptional MocR family regulator
MGISATTIAKAAEALNRVDGLSPSARRVGAELLSHTNKHTGTAWPGERRLSEALGYDLRTINRAKKELAAAGILTWKKRGRASALYVLALDVLLGIARRIAARVKAATARRVASKPAQQAPQRHQPAASEPVENVASERFDRTFSLANISQCFLNIGKGGSWKAPNTPQGQHLTDQQLDRAASARFWGALQALGQTVIDQLTSHPQAEQLQAEAIRAERYRPRGTPDGQAGILKLRSLLTA